jgi:hypothetical protein
MITFVLTYLTNFAAQKPAYPIRLPTTAWILIGGKLRVAERLEPWDFNLRTVLQAVPFTPSYTIASLESFFIICTLYR